MRGESEAAAVDAEEAAVPLPPPSPEKVHAALTVLRDDYRATNYYGNDAPTASSVGLKGKDFQTLTEELVKLLVLVQPEKLSFYECKKLEALPEGSNTPSLTPRTTGAFAAPSSKPPTIRRVRAAWQPQGAQPHLL